MSDIESRPDLDALRGTIESPVVDDATFMENVREALSNGYDRVCARCGIGTAGDDMDMHERGCPEYEPVR